MPQINYDMVNGKKYKYFYGSGLFVNQYFMNGVSCQTSVIRLLNVLELSNLIFFLTYSLVKLM